MAVAVALAVAVSGGGAVAVPVAGLTKKFLITSNYPSKESLTAFEETSSCLRCFTTSD